MTSKSPRKHYTPEEKVAIVRLHLLEHKTVSSLCEEHNIAPSVFYVWQKQLFENGAAAFTQERSLRSHEQKQERRVATLEAKLKQKDAVIAEIAQEYVALKKELGEP